MRNSSHRKELGLCMRRVDHFIVTLILLALVIFPNDLAIGENNKPVIISSGQYGKGYRYNVQGWVYIHIEGEPYERGYQYGYLASAEIVDMIHRWSYWCRNVKIMNLFVIQDPGKWWEMCKSKTMRMYWKYFPEEYQEEIKGVADGIRARGEKVHGHDVGYEDIVTLNQIVDCWYSFQYFSKKFHPLRGIFHGVKNLLQGTNTLAEKGSCSAFIATGNATVDGGIVAAHATMLQYYVPERFNVIVDVQPSKGHRFIMAGTPGCIWSMVDYFQNDQGIILAETTLRQGPWKERGIPIAVRTRKAIQYSDSIDDVLETLLDGNNGLNACEWLIGDTKTGEIATIELALYNTPVRRTFNGFYWSCNSPHDRKVQRETYGAPPVLIQIASKISPDKFINPRAEKFEEIEKEYYGKIDREIAKKIISMDPIGKGSSDGKITDSKLMENMGLLAFMGVLNGSTWIPKDDIKKKFPEVTELPPSGWFELYPSKSKSKNLPLKNIYSNNDESSKVLWHYETDYTQNMNYSSIVISEDIVYSATSSGTIYALDANRGKQIWSINKEEKTVEPIVSKDLVFVGTDTGLYAINKEKGKTKWEQSVGSISSKPIVTKNQVIAGYSNGEIYAFNIDSGRVEWSYSLPDSAYISDLNDNNMLYIGSGKTCYAFDVVDRELLWAFETNGRITAAPKISGNSVYFGSWDGHIYALDSITGDLRWKYETGWGVDSTPYVSEGMVFVGSLDNNFYALDEDEGDLEWAFTCKSAIHSSPTVYGEYVFFGCDDGRLYALDKLNGDLGWSFTPGYYITDENPNNYITTPILSDPVVENGIVYISAKGNIYALDAQTFEVVRKELHEKSLFSIYEVLILVISLIIIIVLISLYIHLSNKKKSD